MLWPLSTRLNHALALALPPHMSLPLPPGSAPLLPLPLPLRLLLLTLLLRLMGLRRLLTVGGGCDRPRRLRRTLRPNACHRQPSCAPASRVTMS